MCVAHKIIIITSNMYRLNHGLSAFKIHKPYITWSFKMSNSINYTCTIFIVQLS